MKLNLLYTADYELYLGENFLPETEVLIHPTTQLLERCNNLNIPLTLFVDTLCLTRYREWEEHTFVDQAETQLQEAYRQGHDLQAHLHPHWPHVKREGKRYLFPPETFLLGRAATTETEITTLTTRLVNECRNYLETLVNDPEYRCFAFRAGGYGLQPHARAVLTGLRQAGIRFDSSIIPGRLGGNMDFRAVPRLANYWLNTNLETPGNTGIWEIPIAATTLNNWHDRSLLLPGAIQGAWRVVTGKGETRGLPCFQPRENTAINRWKRAYWRFRTMLGQRFVFLELGRDHRVMLTCVERYLRSVEPVNDTVTLAMVIHPKGVTGEHLAALERFHREMVRRYGVKALTFTTAT